MLRWLVAHGFELGDHWHRQSYHFAAAFRAGAEPAPSPFSTRFDRTAVPRIRTSHLPWHGERDFCTEFWLHELKQHPKSRYVSDGDPHRVTFLQSQRKYLIALPPARKPLLSDRRNRRPMPIPSRGRSS
jgi:hypothetical protein